MTQDDEASSDLLDAALRDEIELVSDLVVAASSSARHFTPDEVDALLGIPAAADSAADDAADRPAQEAVDTAPEATPDAFPGDVIHEAGPDQRD